VRLRYKIPVVLVLLLALLVAGPAWIPVDKFRLMIEQTVTRSTGMPVTISSLSLRLLPVPGFMITGITILDKQAKEIRATARSGRVTVAILPALSGRLQATRVALQNIVIMVQGKAENKAQRNIRLDSISGQLVEDGHGLKLPAWKAILYHGVILVDARIDSLHDGQSVFKGKARISNVQVLPLLKDATGESRLSAVLNSDLHFSIRRGISPGLKREFIMNGPVHLHDGNLYGISLSGSMMTWLAHQKEDGSIPFEKLDFQLLARDGHVQFRDIRLNAATVVAKGQIDINPQMAINGVVRASGLGGLMNVDLVLAGTVGTPVVSLAPSPAIPGS